MISYHGSTAFNVKVLLEKSSVQELRKNPWNITATHGFVVSDIGDKVSGHFLDTNTCRVSVRKNGFVIGGKPTFTKRLQLDPMLSFADTTTIDTALKKHIKKAVDDLQRHEYLRFDTFKKFLVYNKKEYAKGVQADIFSVVKKGIIAFYKQLGDDPVISFDTLKHRFSTYIDEKIYHQLSVEVQPYQQSKKERRVLRKKEHVRKLYQKVVFDTSYRLLKDFILALPQRVLRNYFNRDCGYVTFDGNKYLGSFFLIQEGNDVLLINSVPIQDYIISVLRTEGWPGWSVEVNKVLAVACRTYLLAKIMQSRAKKLPYHIKNSIVHQTYKGHHNFAKLRKAVDATEHLFLSYKGKPIEAMFDSCCGGIVPAHIVGYDFKNHPYLQRKEACTFCKSCKIAQWKVTYSQEQLQKILRLHGYRIGPIIDIKITKKDKAGLIQEVIIKSKKKILKVPGKKMYNWLPEVKSFAYSIKKQRGKKFLFSGKGYGHHIGLCQWGAMRMVGQGYDFKRVLQFYYPDTTFMKFCEHV